MNCHKSLALAAETLPEQALYGGELDRSPSKKLAEHTHAPVKIEPKRRNHSYKAVIWHSSSLPGSVLETFCTPPCRRMLSSDSSDSTGKARLWSRNRLPLEPKFPTVRDAVDQLNLRSTILDGEIVALG
jgi:hypothetical protein